MNRNLQNILIVNDEVDKRSKMHAVPIQEPRGKELVMRYEPDTKMLFIVAKDFKKYCVDFQVGYKDTLNELKNKGIFVKADTKQMSKGMRVTTSGIHALWLDCSSSDFIDMSSVVEAAKENADREPELQD